MKRRTYAKRLRIPLVGNNDTKFYTQDGLLVATGYSRVVIGGRGPYIEFDDEHIVKSSFHVPKHAEYKLHQTFTYYYEYRSNDKCFVKAYYQQMGVSYANYKIGKWYIDPDKLKTDTMDNLLLPPYSDIEEIKTEKKVNSFDWMLP